MLARLTVQYEYDIGNIQGTDIKIVWYSYKFGAYISKFSENWYKYILFHIFHEN
jgi:hypothetical protein